MQSHQFLHIFHMLVERQTHAAENLGHHLFAHKIMVVEGPSLMLVPSFGGGFANVVHQRRPAQPLVIALLGYIVEHLHGVQEIVLMAASVRVVNAAHGLKFWEDEAQQSALMQQFESARRHIGTHDFHQFFGNALAGDNVDAVRVASDSIECLGEDIKVELGGKSNGTHHAQRVVAEGDIGIKGRADDASSHVADAVEGVEQLAE